MGESMVSAPQSAADQTEAGMLPEKNEGAWRFHAVNSRAGWFLWHSNEENSNKLLVFSLWRGCVALDGGFFPAAAIIRRTRRCADDTQPREETPASGLVRPAVPISRMS